VVQAIRKTNARAVVGNGGTDGDRALDVTDERRRGYRRGGYRLRCIQTGTVHTDGDTDGDRALDVTERIQTRRTPGTEHFIKRPQRISVDYKRHTRLQTLDAI
jgi:hypothetical protein